MRIVYNDKTPLEYTPKHFSDSYSSDTASSQEFAIGTVTTPHHIFRLRVATSNNFEESGSDSNQGSDTYSQRFNNEEAAESVENICKLLQQKGVKSQQEVISFVTSRFPSLPHSSLEGGSH